MGWSTRSSEEHGWVAHWWNLGQHCFCSRYPQSAMLLLFRSLLLPLLFFGFISAPQNHVAEPVSNMFVQLATCECCGTRHGGNNSRYTANKEGLLCNLKFRGYLWISLYQYIIPNIPLK